MLYVTYLLGAGASANEMPVDNALTKKLEEFLQISQTYLDTSTVKGYLSNFLRAHDWLLEEFKIHKSLHVIAKKHAENETRLFNIKTILWLYFSSHAGKDKLDSRYESLLIRLSGGGKTKSPIPENISFLTWNYDLQLEETFTNLK